MPQGSRRIAPEPRIVGFMSMRPPREKSGRTGRERKELEMAKVITLGRCPHCGGIPEVHKASGPAGGDSWWVECGECGVKTGNSLGLDGAVEKWNRRTCLELPKGKNGEPIRLGDIVRGPSGFTGQVACIEYALSGDVSVSFGSSMGYKKLGAEMVEHPEPARVSEMLCLEDDMQLSPEEYCGEVLEHDEASDLLPLAAMELKMRDVKRRLDKLEAME